MGLIARMHARTGQRGQVLPSVGLLTAPEISTVRADYSSGELWARAIIVLGFRKAMGRNPTLPEAQFAQAVARGETYYGRAWKDEGVGSYNWGAVQAGRPPCDPEKAFPYGDTHEDGAPYAACFRKYPNDVEGAQHFIKIMMKPNVVAAANSSSIEGVSSNMRANHYFELPLDKHIVALTRNLRDMTKVLGEPMPQESGGGSVVVAGLIGLLAIGMFIKVVA